jgi:hypothetical protein
MQRQQMNFAIAVVRAELYTWHYTNAERFTCNRSEWNSSESVVIGECERPESRLVCRRDNCVRRERAIGCRRVGMKIDERRRSRGVPALNHRA